VTATAGGSPKGMAAYAAAKSGVLSLMRTVALDEKAHGVRANAVAPTASAAGEQLVGGHGGTEARRAVKGTQVTPHH